MHGPAAAGAPAPCCLQSHGWALPHLGPAPRPWPAEPLPAHAASRCGCAPTLPNVSPKHCCCCCCAPRADGAGQRQDGAADGQAPGRAQGHGHLASGCARRPRRTRRTLHSPLGSARPRWPRGCVAQVPASARLHPSRPPTWCTSPSAHPPPPHPTPHLVLPRCPPAPPRQAPPSRACTSWSARARGPPSSTPCTRPRSAPTSWPSWARGPGQGAGNQWESESVS